MNFVMAGAWPRCRRNCWNERGGSCFRARPLITRRKDDLAKFAGSGDGLPIIPCNLAGTQDGLQRDRRIENRCWDEWERRSPACRGGVFQVMGACAGQRCGPKPCARFAQCSTLPAGRFRRTG